jgi:glycosyltransferase involved in cell wall biosynthesis
VVVVFPFDATLVYPTIADGEKDQARKQEAMRAREWLAALPERALETVLAGGMTADGRVRVLLDCRGMPDFHNGTAHAILGVLEGFTFLDTRKLEITVVASSAAARFHNLENRYKHFHFEFDQLMGHFLVAVRLNQPWASDTIVELHEHALFIAFNMLDTIAWDIMYSVPREVDQTWRLLAIVADGLLFISNYTRERFVFRFKPCQSTVLVVAHLSMKHDELTRGSVMPAPFAEPFILVFGNTYDHKGVPPTLMTLVDAFPFIRIVAVGLESFSSPRVTVLESGKIGEPEINGLMVGAAVVVFPSFYEGFGLPVVQSLARGRTVVVRKSLLWEEIATYADLPGTLVSFEDEFGLVEAVGRAVHNLPSQGLNFGAVTKVGSDAPSWRACAERIVELIDNLIFEGDGTRWIQRQVIFTRPAPTQ